MAGRLNADILSEGIVLTGPDGTPVCEIDGLLKAKNEDKFFLVESKMTVQVITAVVTVTASVLGLTTLFYLGWFCLQESHLSIPANNLSLCIIYKSQLPSTAPSLLSSNCSLVMAGELFHEKTRKLAKATGLHVAYPDGSEFAIVAPSDQPCSPVLLGK